MKTSNFYKICIILMTMCLSLSCNQNDDFNAPVSNGPKVPDPEIEANITIAEVKAMLSGSMTTFDSGLILEGYVVSSDASGNFYKELYLQDHPSNPTTGIRVALDKSNLYLAYDIGRKIFINLEGLSISKSQKDVFTIGKEDVDEIGGIGESEVLDYIIKSNTVKTIEAKPMLFSEITDDHIGMFISVSNTQFMIDQIGLPFTDAEADTQRMLESCEEDAYFMLQTSAFADFGHLMLPVENGMVSGIVTKDDSGNTLIMALNNTDDMVYEGTRCGFQLLNCVNIKNGESIIFEEDFEEITESDLDDLGWINVNVNGSERKFEPGVLKDNDNTFMAITALDNEEESLEAWLITPVINLDGTNNEQLSFDIEAAYDNGRGLMVLITENYTGDPETTQWIVPNINIPNGPSDGYSGFSASGLININCLEGNVRIAFRYQGANPDLTTLYHIDNVRVTGN